MTCQVKAYCGQRSIPPRRCTLCAASCRLVLHDQGGETVVCYLFAMCSGGRQLIATQLSFGITLCGMRFRSPTMVPAVHQQYRLTCRVRPNWTTISCLLYTSDAADE